MHRLDSRKSLRSHRTPEVPEANFSSGNVTTVTPSSDKIASKPSGAHWDPRGLRKASRPLLKTAISATLHCLLGCSIGEVLGMVLGTAWEWSNFATVVLSIGLAFLFGYALSLLPLMRAGLTFKAAIPIVLAADTLSILSMEIVDNLVVISVPGAMDAGLTDSLFWASLALSLVIAFIVTVPVNWYLLTRGKGHALVHEYHHKHK
jgi:hypothetical protein